MIRRVNGCQLIAAGALLGLASCNQSTPPAVAVVDTEQPIAPAVVAKPTDGIAAPKNNLLPDGGTFPFPDDTSGRSLAKTLTPAVPPALPGGGSVVPKERKLPPFIDTPEPPVTDATAPLPRLPLPPARAARPTPLPDRVRDDLGGTTPLLPDRGEIPSGPLTRTEHRDVDLPLELPILSPRPVPDRAPLADPTLEFTARSVINPHLPLRTEQMRFWRFNLPDPFEHAEAARPRTPVVDDPNRSLVMPPPPRQ